MLLLVAFDKTPFKTLSGSWASAHSSGTEAPRSAVQCTKKSFLLYSLILLPFKCSGRVFTPFKNEWIIFFQALSLHPTPQFISLYSITSSSSPFHLDVILTIAIKHKRNSGCLPTPSIGEPPLHPTHKMHSRFRCSLLSRFMLHLLFMSGGMSIYSWWALIPFLLYKKWHSVSGQSKIKVKTKYILLPSNSNFYFYFCTSFHGDLGVQP